MIEPEPAGEERGPLDLVELVESQFVSPEDLGLPDVVEFVEHPALLGRPRLYPRQKTILRLMFLELGNLTDYDLEVLDEWTSGMAGEGEVSGVSPDVLERARILLEGGRSHFREVVFIGGRRGGKNHVGAAALAYLTYRLLRMRAPQYAYSIDPNKELRCLVAATNYFQARDNQFADLAQALMYAPCFEGRVAKVQSGLISVRTDFDLVWEQAQERAFGRVRRTSASLVCQAVTSNTAAARGVASYAMAFDEQAHMPATAGPRAAEEGYSSMTPALDQMKRRDRWGRVVDDAFIYIPTSPYTRAGVTWEVFRDALATDPDTGAPTFPEMLAFQLPSWHPYEGWDDERACGGRQWLFSSAPQTYDETMRRLERRNPRRFRVERRAQWADVEAAYLDDAAIRGLFLPVPLPDGTEPTPEMQARGLLSRDYRAHLDAASSQSNFAAMVAHLAPVKDEDTGETWAHVFVDWFTVWRPQDFPEGFIDYTVVERELVERLSRFKTLERVTFDQYASAAVRSMLTTDLPAAGLQARVEQVTFTAANNRARYDALKDALGMRWVHAPVDDLWGDREGSLLEAELRSLQEVRGRVGAPDWGPVTTDDLCDALAELTSQLLDEQLAGSSVGERLSAIRPAFGARGGYRTGAEPGPRLRGAGMRNGRPSNVRERLEAWSMAEAVRRGPVPPGWTRGLSRWGRRWF